MLWNDLKSSTSSFWEAVHIQDDRCRELARRLHGQGFDKHGHIRVVGVGSDNVRASLQFMATRQIN